MKLLRRAHLYSELFMTPWVSLYGATALVFNQPDLFSGRQVIDVGPAELAARVIEKLNAADPAVGYRRTSGDAARYAQPLTAGFSRDGKPYNLQFDLATLDGAVRESPPRQGRGGVGGVGGAGGALNPERPTGDPAAAGPGTDRVPPRARQFLLNLHKAHGYPAAFGPRWAWAVAVDAMFLSMCGWGLTGLLMWWQMKNLRPVGSVILVVSAATGTVMIVAMHGAMGG